MNGCAVDKRKRHSGAHRKAPQAGSIECPMCRGKKKVMGPVVGPGGKPSGYAMVDCGLCKTLIDDLPAGRVIGFGIGACYPGSSAGAAG